MLRMRVPTAGWLLLAAILPVLGATTASAEPKPGDAGFLSLRLGVGAREAAMGGAGVAATDDAAGIYWNPARLAFTDLQTGLLVQHQEWMGVVRLESAAIAHRTRFGMIGLIFTGMHSDDIERYGLAPVGIPEGTFTAEDVILGLSFARQVTDDLAVGATAKFLHQKIDLWSDSGLAFDLYLAHRAAVEGLTLGASLTNVGPQMQLLDDPYDLPAALRVGASYDPPSRLLAGRLTLAADFMVPNDGDEKAHVGAEFRLVPELALRAGTNLNYDNQGLTAGLGFHRGALGIDYAYTEMKEDAIDAGHRFALQLRY